jgi:hypothetical protein
MNQLRERLEMPKGFKSYGEIQEWITSGGDNEAKAVAL